MIYHCHRAWGGSGHSKNSQIPSWGDWHESAPVIFHLASQCAQPQPIAQHITPHLRPHHEPPPPVQGQYTEIEALLCQRDER